MASKKEQYLFQMFEIPEKCLDLLQLFAPKHCEKGPDRTLGPNLQYFVSTCSWYSTDWGGGFICNQWLLTWRGSPRLETPGVWDWQAGICGYKDTLRGLLDLPPERSSLHFTGCDVVIVVVVAGPYHSAAGSHGNRCCNEHTGGHTHTAGRA